MTVEALLDRPPSSEQLAFHPVDAAINTSANSPAKMLTFLVLAENPGVPITGTVIKDRLNEAQGGEPGWELETGGGHKQYCRFSLVPAGLAVETKVTTARGVVPAFEITERGLEWGVPLFGALLDLELRSNFSSQRTFGAINGAPGGSPDVMRSSLVRMRVLEEVHAAQDRPVNLASLCRLIPRTKTVVNTAVNDLTTAGMLHVLRKSNPADRTLILSRPNNTFVRQSQMRPEIAAVHRAVAALYGRGVRDLDGSTLLDEAEHYMPGLDRAQLWKDLADTIPHCLTFADEARFGSNTGKSAPRIRIEVAREHETVVEELVRSVAAVRDSAGYRKLAAAQARQIMSQEHAVAYLMGRAKSNSSSTKYDVDETYRSMERLAGKLLGWVSLRRLLTLDSDWRSDVACRYEDPELFYGLKETMNEVEAEKARAVCANCTSRLHCLKWAVERPEPYGMWGGYTETERRNLPKDIQTLLGMIQLRG